MKIQDVISQFLKGFFSSDDAVTEKNSVVEKKSVAAVPDAVDAATEDGAESDHDYVRGIVRDLLAAEYADADRKMEDCHYWDQAGKLVLQAAMRCEAILCPVADGDLGLYFDRVLPALKDLAAEYRQSDDDPDGFALGTVRHFEECFKTLVERDDWRLSAGKT